MTTNEAAERLRTYLVSPVETHPSELQTLLDAALAAERQRAYAEGMDDGRLVEQAACREKVAAERRNAGQCDGYAGDAGASAPRCESYAGHPSRHFIRFDGKAHEDMVRRATVERMTTALIREFPVQGSYNRTAVWQAIYRVRDKEAAR